MLHQCKTSLVAVVLLGTLQTSLPLQSPDAVPWGSPGATLLFAGSLAQDGAFPKHLPSEAQRKQLSPVTSSEVSETEGNGLLSPMPFDEDCGGHDAWLLQDDWKLPPPAASFGAADVVPMDSDAGVSESLGNSCPWSVVSSEGQGPLKLQQALTRTRSALSSPAGAVVRRHICDNCNIKEACRASVKWEGKRCVWDRFLCRFCAPARALSTSTSRLINLRGRCRRCPKTATFAPLSFPRHISFHCQDHMLAGEMSRAKRYALIGGSACKADVDSSSQGNSCSSLHLSQAAPPPPFLLDDDASTCKPLTAPGHMAKPLPKRASRRRGSHKTGERSFSTPAVASNCRLGSPGASGLPWAVSRHRSSSCTDVDDYIWQLGVDSMQDWALNSSLAGPDSCATHLSAAAAEPTSTAESSEALVRAVIVKDSCREEGCVATVAFGCTSDGIARACKKHRRKQEVRLTAQRKGGMCIHADGCLTRACFGFASDGLARFCASHKQPCHVNVRTRRQLHA